MYAYAIPKGAVYTEVLPPTTASHVWGKMEDTWYDLSELEENPLHILEVHSDCFNSISLRTGHSVEISDDGVTWVAWQPLSHYIQANVEDEGKIIEAYGERDTEGDVTIGGVHYYCWVSNPYDIYTTSETPSVGDTAYKIVEGVIFAKGSVTNYAEANYYHEVSNGIVYVRAKSGSAPIYGFSGLYAKVSGPVMSLVDYDNVDTCVLAPHQFSNTIYYGQYSEAGLFYDISYTFLENSSSPFFSDASGLIMPSGAQVLSTSAYAMSMMFNNCVTLSSGKLPTLRTPAIAQGLYDCFFYGCISMKFIPSGYLDQTFTATPGVAPYSFMFSKCVSLTSIPSGLLNTNYLGGVFWSDSTWGYQSAYTEMFSNCYSLKSVPYDLLPATTLTPCCYGHMFMNCVSLENSPALPAQTLASGCYKGMFEGCSSLEECPALAATILPSEVVIEGVDSARGCYQRMFMGCSSILNSPALTALNLTPYCYSEMFEDCSALDTVTCLATDITAEQCTASWLSGVADRGLFHRNSTTWAYWTIGVSGIPENWDIDPEKPADHLCVNYPYEGTTTHLAFVRYPYGDEVDGATHYYAWTIGTMNFDTVYTTILQGITTSTTLYKKEVDSFIQSTGTIESPVFTKKVSIVVENSASGVLANKIDYHITEGSYTNSNQYFTGAITGDSSVEIKVDGTNWKWYDDDTSPLLRTFDIPAEGLFARVVDA